MKSNDENPRATQSKSTKKSNKSRSKSSTQTNTQTAATVANATCNNSNINNSFSNLSNAPTTPTTTSNLNNNLNNSTNNFDANQTASSTSSNMYEGSSGSRSHHKSYAGFEPRSIKIIWEQHDQSDLELSQDVCTRLAEDASYKLWELINNLKTYARHSGGVITYDLVNEVLRDADVPPVLGAMDSEWERIDYDGSFFFYSDKILELRDEYQKEINIEMPNGADFQRSYLIDDKHIESMKKYVTSIVYVTIHGDAAAFETVLQEIAFAPLLGNCFRVLLAKIIEILAYKQSDPISERCWRLLKTATINPTVRALDCREEFFHLAEILVCQLIGPFEAIKVHRTKNQNIKTESKYEVKAETNGDIKMEQQSTEDSQSTIKTDMHFTAPQAQTTPINGENIFRLQAEDDGTNDGDCLDLSTCSNAIDGGGGGAAKTFTFSPYFASPVDMMYLNDLCATLGSLADMSGYFERESTFLITRRLKRFFSGRQISTEREYNFIGRTLRGLVALGEYAFREFIPYLYKFEADDVPESMWNDIALSAVYLQGDDDIFLYEWLEYVCGGDKLQPFMCYYAEYFEKLMTVRFLKRRPPTFKINPKPGVRRLEWSTIVAAMCRGDDPNKALKPKPTLTEMFPELKTPNLRLNRAGTIRFKFAGCRPVLLKRPTVNEKCADDPARAADEHRNCVQHDILIAKRKLYKPLTNDRRGVFLSSFHYLRI